MVEVYLTVLLMLPCEAKCNQQDPTVLSCYNTIACMETVVILRSSYPFPLIIWLLEG